MLPSGLNSAVVCQGSNDSRSTFYASGWSLMRWAADHYATDEAEFLKATAKMPKSMTLNGSTKSVRS